MRWPNETCWVSIVDVSNYVFPHNPQKWPIGEFKAKGQFFEPSAVKHSETPECNINDRFGRLLVKPCQTTC